MRQDSQPDSSDSVALSHSPYTVTILDNDHEVLTLLDQVETVILSLSFSYVLSLIVSCPIRVNQTAFTTPSRMENGTLPLPISRKLFEVTTQKFDTSPAYLSALETGLATYTGTIPEFRRAKKNWENARFVVQQNRAYSALSIALTFNVKSGKSRALIFGADYGLLTGLFECMGGISTRRYWPMLIPILAMEVQVHSFNRGLMVCHDGIYSIESRTGMRRFDYSLENSSPQDWKTLDLISITRDLSSFLSIAAFLEMQAETSAYLMQQIAQTTESITEVSASDERYIDHLYEVSPRLENARNLYLGLASRCRYLTKRINAQAQTVYCLIASQDQVSNMSIAGASRDIALMTARDGATMRVIAAVTILFLPATFVATLFSTSFFNFQDTSGPRVSGWVWIYVLVTVILTVAVQSVWAIISKRKARKIAQNMPV
ncbi:hypothetical protein NPX13_g6906 [Xylaria arbuscula]|uniref:Uncharacterized protein n=1 Tax=Xylaria arbuscula TaxID=114810 RepID=A0A9W8NBK4_9PEZI|nr:hypothetical protein NPX13_g6906 [Xylaria arbuscula]